MSDNDLELPPGIADAELWRQRVRAILAAAGDEGLVVPELITAIEANHGELFDRRRVLRWLRAEHSAGLADEDDDGMWQVRSGDAADIEDFLRGLDDSGTPGLPDSAVFFLGDEGEEGGWFKAPACRVCGCTEDAGCAGGCWWVPDPWQDGDLCSACLPPDPAPTAEQLHRRACQTAQTWLAEQDIAADAEQLRDAVDGAYPGGWNQFMTDHNFPLGL